MWSEVTWAILFQVSILQTWFPKWISNLKLYEKSVVCSSHKFSIQAVKQKTHHVMGKIRLLHIFLFLFLFFSFFCSCLLTWFCVWCNVELVFLFGVIIPVITINLVIFYFFESRTQSCPMVARNMCSSLASLWVLSCY